MIQDVNWGEKKLEEEVVEKQAKRNYLFGEFLKSINETKRDSFDEDEKDVRFVANMMLGNSIETVLYANEVNQLPDIPKRAHYLYLLKSVPKGRRFAKGVKADKELVSRLQIIKDYFICNDRRAKEINQIITDTQLDEIVAAMDKGGR
jgi:hypothetical protein